MDSIWISIGKKTGLLCLVAVVGSVVLFRQKKILRSIMGNMFQVANTIEENRHRSSLLSWDEEDDEEEDLEAVELWLVIHRLEDVHLRKPIEQKVVVINDQTLQKLNKSKWVSVSLKKQQQQQHFDIIETSAPFLKVKPSLQATPFLAACDGNIMYLLGGKYYATRASRYSLSDVTYGIDVANVVSGKTEEHIHQIPRMIQRQRVVGAAVTSEKRIYAFGRMYFAYGVHDLDRDTSTFGEMYDMVEKCWTYFEQLPFEEAPLCTVLGCVMWHSMIVLFLQRIQPPPQKEVVEVQVGDDDDDYDDDNDDDKEVEVSFEYKMVTTVSYYDLKEKKWISTVAIDEDDGVEISLQCFPVLVDEDNIVFIVQSSGLYRYDLVEKRITGKTQGLQQMKELTERGIRDVVYLGSSDDKKYLKFCIFWEGYKLRYEKFMRFAIIKVGDDDDLGDNLTVWISSSVASIPLYKYDRFIKGAHKIIRDKHMMFDESQPRHEEEEEEEIEEDNEDYIIDLTNSYLM